MAQSRFASAATASETPNDAENTFVRELVPAPTAEITMYGNPSMPAVGMAVQCGDVSLIASQETVNNTLDGFFDVAKIAAIGFGIGAGGAVVYRLTRPKKKTKSRR